MDTKKFNKRFNEKERKIQLIQDFGKSMGYKVKEYYYDSYANGRPCFSILLEGTSDGEGEPYSWVWYRDTWEERWEFYEESEEKND